MNQTNVLKFMEAVDLKYHPIRLGISRQSLLALLGQQQFVRSQEELLLMRLTEVKSWSTLAETDFYR